VTDGPQRRVGPERQVGVDSGGTFTDVVLPDGSLAKLPSTPDDPGRAVRRAVEDTGHGRPALLAHGSTVATNALLEGRLGRVALITTEGFTDVVEIGRQDRPSLYDQWADRPAPLVHRDDRLEVGERLDADVGDVRERLPEQGHAVVDRDQRLLVLRAAHHADDDLVEHRGGAPDDVDVAERDGVVGPRADGDPLAHARARMARQAAPTRRL